MWHLDEVRLSIGLLFDKGFDEWFDEGLNEKWFDDDGLSERPDNARMVGGGEAVVKACFHSAPAPGIMSESGAIESTSIELLKRRRLLMSVEITGMLDDEEMLVLVWG